MNTAAGTFVSFTNAFGLTQKGLVSALDQRDELKITKKVAVRLIDDELLPLLDENQVQRRVLVYADKLRVIGYQD